jgi:hypothetical protein
MAGPLGMCCQLFRTLSGISFHVTSSFHDGQSLASNEKSGDLHLQWFPCLVASHALIPSEFSYLLKSALLLLVRPCTLCNVRMAWFCRIPDGHSLHGVLIVPVRLPLCAKAFAHFPCVHYAELYMPSTCCLHICYVVLLCLLCSCSCRLLYAVSHSV